MWDPCELFLERGVWVWGEELFNVREGEVASETEFFEVFCEGEEERDVI